MLCLLSSSIYVHAGGGFHHCSGDEGGGFCAYADITLSINVNIKYTSHVSLSL